MFISRTITKESPFEEDLELASSNNQTRELNEKENYNKSVPKFDSKETPLCYDN